MSAQENKQLYLSVRPDQVIDESGLELTEKGADALNGYRQYIASENQKLSIAEIVSYGRINTSAIQTLLKKDKQTYPNRQPATREDIKSFWESIRSGRK